MKRRKMNITNLILLIIMLGCIGIIAFDYLRIIISMFGSYTLGFTWFGIIVDFTALITADLIYQNLFE